MAGILDTDWTVFGWGMKEVCRGDGIVNGVFVQYVLGTPCLLYCEHSYSVTPVGQYQTISCRIYTFQVNIFSIQHDLTINTKRIQLINKIQIDLSIFFWRKLL